MASPDSASAAASLRGEQPFPRVPLLALQRTLQSSTAAAGSAFFGGQKPQRLLLPVIPLSPAVISDVASGDEASSAAGEDCCKALTCRAPLRTDQSPPPAPRGSVTQRGSSKEWPYPQGGLPGELGLVAEAGRSKQRAFREWREAMKALSESRRAGGEETAEAASSCSAAEAQASRPNEAAAAASQPRQKGPPGRRSLAEQAAAARDFAMKFLHFSSRVEETQTLQQRVKQQGALTSRALAPPSDGLASSSRTAPRRSFFLKGGVSSHAPVAGAESLYAERARMQALTKALETQRKHAQAQTPREGLQRGAVRPSSSASASRFPGRRRSNSGSIGGGQRPLPRAEKAAPLDEDTRAAVEKARALRIAQQRGAPDKLVGSYLLGKTIGEGTFCKVRAATHAVTGECVAVKVIGKDQLKEAADAERVCREVHILKAVRHPHVVRLLEVLETPTHLYLVMEFASGGELFDYIVQRRRVDESTACKIFRQLIAGVEALHSLCICHRDLKPENLLLDEEGQLKIIDFGLSNLYRNKCLLRTACGSPSYAAPEMILGKLYSPLAVDVWSCGIVLYALLTGRLPFEEATTECLYRQIVKGNFECPDFLSADAVSLLRGILCTNPLKRWSPAQIRRHPWFRDAAPGYKPPRNPDVLKWPQGPPSCGCNACAAWLSSENQALDRELLKQIPADGLALDALEAHIFANPVGTHAATYHLLVSRRRKEEQFQRAAARGLSVEEASGLARKAREPPREKPQNQQHSAAPPHSARLTTFSAATPDRDAEEAVATRKGFFTSRETNQDPRVVLAKGAGGRGLSLCERRASASVGGVSPRACLSVSPPRRSFTTLGGQRKAQARVSAEGQADEGMAERRAFEALQPQSQPEAQSQSQSQQQPLDGLVVPRTADSRSPSSTADVEKETLHSSAERSLLADSKTSRPVSQSVSVSAVLQGSEEVLPPRAALSELSEEARCLEMTRLKRLEAQRSHVVEQMRRLAESTGSPTPCAFLNERVLGSLLQVHGSLEEASRPAKEAAAALRGVVVSGLNSKAPEEAGRGDSTESKTQNPKTRLSSSKPRQPTGRPAPPVSSGASTARGVLRKEIIPTRAAAAPSRASAKAVRAAAASSVEASKQGPGGGRATADNLRLRLSLGQKTASSNFSAARGAAPPPQTKAAAAALNPLSDRRWLLPQTTRGEKGPSLPLATARATAQQQTQRGGARLRGVSSLGPAQAPLLRRASDSSRRASGDQRLASSFLAGNSQQGRASQGRGRAACSGSAASGAGNGTGFLTARVKLSEGSSSLLSRRVRLAHATAGPRGAARERSLGSAGIAAPPMTARSSLEATNSQPQEGVLAGAAAERTSVRLAKPPAAAAAAAAPERRTRLVPKAASKEDAAKDRDTQAPATAAATSTAISASRRLSFSRGKNDVQRAQSKVSAPPPRPWRAASGCVKTSLNKPPTATLPTRPFPRPSVTAAPKLGLSATAVASEKNQLRRAGGGGCTDSAREPARPAPRRSASDLPPRRLSWPQGQTGLVSCKTQTPRVPQTARRAPEPRQPSASCRLSERTSRGRGASPRRASSLQRQGAPSARAVFVSSAKNASSTAATSRGRAFL